MMRIYGKWALLILGPFVLIVGGLIWYTFASEKEISRDELDESYNSEQVKRLQMEKAEKRFLDEQWRKKQKPRTGP